ncbi:hypothetical protein EVAR_99552_1 [Eumeta japonica]|uniref:Uncharacterized protein n=1 Tax=Eumeta variegata TaxID=151549 RepID=A0A4C1YXF1_EUMVA|nr:hypothetical protein EVAR_99552_1 [Eumeta japonica]
MDERDYEIVIDENTSMYITRPHRWGDTCVRRVSERSYAAAVYWRVKFSENENAVSLIVGKAHVVPLKIISISRLELQTALLDARLTSLIMNEIKFNVC